MYMNQQYHHMTPNDMTWPPRVSHDLTRHHMTPTRVSHDLSFPQCLNSLSVREDITSDSPPSPVSPQLVEAQYDLVQAWRTLLLVAASYQVSWTKAIVSPLHLPTRVWSATILCDSLIPRVSPHTNYIVTLPHSFPIAKLWTTGWGLFYVLWNTLWHTFFSSQFRVSKVHAYTTVHVWQS